MPKSMSTSQNPKYQLFLNHEMKTNGVSGKEANGSVGSGSTAEHSPRMARWETTRLGMNHYRGSLESLASRDGDMDRVSEVDHGDCVCVIVCQIREFRDYLITRCEPLDETHKHLLNSAILWITNCFKFCNGLQI